MDWRRIAGVLIAGCAAAVALSGSASAKDGARARLLSSLPLGAAPGAIVRVHWVVDVPDGHGGRRPFGASGMVVRLLSRTGAHWTQAASSPSADGDVNIADVRVPEGGIGGIRLGLQGTACGPAGCHSAPLLFPIVNSPFLSPGGAVCDAAALATRLTAFVRAYNRGDLAALERIFSRRSFKWYSSAGPGPRMNEEATNRGTLIAYLAERHHHGDRISRLAFRFNGYDRGFAHFELTATRRADDYRGGRWFAVLGKGALDCGTLPPTIAVLSIGGPA